MTLRGGGKNILFSSRSCILFMLLDYKDCVRKIYAKIEIAFLKSTVVEDFPSVSLLER
jgi:hypothetical protein